MDLYTIEELVGPDAVVAGYFNSDIYLDIAIANYDGSNVDLLLGDGDVVGNFNNDSRLDIVVVNVDDGNIAIFLGNGDGTLTVQTIISTGIESYPDAAAVTYFNSDNILDIVITIGGTNRIGVFIGNRNGTFQSSKLFSTGADSEPSWIAIGDLNHDNRLDVGVSNYGNNKVTVLLGYGNGSFRAQTNFSAGMVRVWMDVTDFNGNGDLDFAALNAKNNNVNILLGIGNGTFRIQVKYPVRNSSFTFFFALGDVNNDGRWDIAIPNTIDNNICILLGRIDGSFEAQTVMFMEEKTRSAVVAIVDFNKDNRSDIVVTNGDSNEIVIILQTS